MERANVGTPQKYQTKQLCAVDLLLLLKTQVAAQQHSHRVEKYGSIVMAETRESGRRRR
jgi:tryptophan 2,3-dioxygenase